jgi:hypothetical protein
MYINDIFFKANSVQYHILLKEPICGVSFEEIKVKAEKEVKSYMLKESIPGPYKILFL